MSAATSPPRRAGLREWAGLAVLALPTLLVAMDITVLHLAVPELTRDLRPSGTELLWIVDVYGFLIAGWLIPMGVLGDRFGRRRVLMIGGAAFAAASALVAFAPTPATLIAGRALLGVAGATLMPSTLSLIRALFEDPAQRTVAIGVWVASLSLGVVVGPIVGGALLELFWWGSVFLIAIPVMGLLLALGPWLLPEVRDPDPGRVDLASVALALGSMLTLIYGIKQIAAHGVEPVSAASIVIALALGVTFVRRQRRLADPLLDLGLFRNRAFTAALSANTLTFVALLGLFLFLAQYLQLVLGYGPLEAGLWLLPYAAAVIAGSFVAAPLAQRVAPGAVLAAGLVVAALGVALLSRIDGDGGLGIFAAGSVVMGLGVAPVITLATDLVVGAAPPERAGAASAISETGTELGAALGVAILGSVGTAVYSDRAGDAVPDTLGAAVEAANAMPGERAAALLELARPAFVDGLATAATLGAGLLLLTALMTAVVLVPRRSGFREGAGAQPAGVD